MAEHLLAVLLQQGLSVWGAIHTGESQSSYDQIDHKVMAALVRKQPFQVIYSLLDFAAPTTGTIKPAEPIGTLHSGRTSVYTDAYLWWCERMWTTPIVKHISALWQAVCTCQSEHLLPQVTPWLPVAVSHRTFVSHQCECCLRHPAGTQKCKSEKSEAVKWVIFTLQPCVTFPLYQNAE